MSDGRMPCAFISRTRDASIEGGRPRNPSRRALTVAALTQHIEASAGFEPALEAYREIAIFHHPSMRHRRSNLGGFAMRRTTAIPA
jgi:hypothetical protein